jgi:hypothetical protein
MLRLFAVKEPCTAHTFPAGKTPRLQGRPMAVKKSPNREAHHVQ